MFANLLVAYLVAISPAPAWSALSVSTAAQLSAEGIGEAQYAQIGRGEIIIQRRKTPAGKTGVHVAAIALIRGRTEIVFEAVADCKRLPEYMPHLDACNDAVPDVPLPPNERWNENHLSFGVFPVKVRVKIVQHAVLDAPNKLTWTRVKGDTKVNEGYWRIISLQPDLQVLVYDTLSDPGQAIPEFMQRLLTENDLPKTVEAVRKRVEVTFAQR